MLTVIIPLYNKEKHIIETLQSVLNQTYKHFEVLVVDDGSTDNSVEYLNRLKDCRIRIISQTNAGVSSARNTGIENSKYDWITFLDADDLWQPNHLSNFMDVIHTIQNVNVIGSAFSVSNSNGEIIKTIGVKHNGFYNYYEQYRIQGESNLCSSSLCVKKDILVDIRYNTNLSYGEDYHFYEQLANRTEFYYLKESTALYIKDTENKSTSKSPEISHTNAYHFSFSPSISPQKKFYYKLNILTLIHIELKKFNIPFIYKMLKRHKSNLTFNDFTNYILYKINLKKHQ